MHMNIYVFFFFFQNLNILCIFWSYIVFFFSTKKKRNFIHPKRTKLHFVGAKSTTQPWVQNQKKEARRDREVAIKPQSKENNTKS
jgi:hypothetical protein